MGVQCAYEGDYPEHVYAEQQLQQHEGDSFAGPSGFTPNSSSVFTPTASPLSEPASLPELESPEERVPTPPPTDAEVRRIVLANLQLFGHRTDNLPLAPFEAAYRAFPPHYRSLAYVLAANFPHSPGEDVPAPPQDMTYVPPRAIEVVSPVLGQERALSSLRGLRGFWRSAEAAEWARETQAFLEQACPGRFIRCSHIPWNDGPGQPSIVPDSAPMRVAMQRDEDWTERAREWQRLASSPLPFPPPSPPSPPLPHPPPAAPDPDPVHVDHDPVHVDHRIRYSAEELQRLRDLRDDLLSVSSPPSYVPSAPRVGRLDPGSSIDPAMVRQGMERERMDSAEDVRRLRGIREIFGGSPSPSPVPRQENRVEVTGNGAYQLRVEAAEGGQMGDQRSRNDRNISTPVVSPARTEAAAAGSAEEQRLEDRFMRLLAWHTENMSISEIFQEEARFIEYLDNAHRPPPSHPMLALVVAYDSMNVERLNRMDYVQRLRRARTRYSQVVVGLTHREPYRLELSALTPVGTSNDARARPNPSPIPEGAARWLEGIRRHTNETRQAHQAWRQQIEQSDRQALQRLVVTHAEVEGLERLPYQAVRQLLAAATVGSRPNELEITLDEFRRIMESIAGPPREQLAQTHQLQQLERQASEPDPVNEALRHDLRHSRMRRLQQRLAASAWGSQITESQIMANRSRRIVRTPLQQPLQHRAPYTFAQPPPPPPAFPPDIPIRRTLQLHRDTPLPGVVHYRLTHLPLEALASFNWRPGPRSEIPLPHLPEDLGNVGGTLRLRVERWLELGLDLPTLDEIVAFEVRLAVDAWWIGEDVGEDLWDCWCRGEVMRFGDLSS